MADLLGKICNENTGKIKLIEAYECNNEHVGLIVEAKNKMTDEIERIIIDAVIGYPVTEQVYETVYKKGAKCDKRIIIYTEGLAESFHYGGVDDDIIVNLVHNLNKYGTNIFLARLEKGNYKVPLEYTVTAEPPENLKYSLTDLPSEARLKEEEFWQIYYGRQMECFYAPWKTFKNQIHGHIDFGHMWESCGVNIYAKWSEEVIFFEAKDATEDSECLEPIWNTRKHELQMLYPDAEMTFIMKSGKLAKLIIKMWPTPIQSLVNASVSEKKRLASEILEKFGNFIDFITDPLNDMDNAKIDEVHEVV